MKTKKFLVSIVLIVVCVGVVLGLTACGSPFTEEINQAVFDDLVWVAGQPENLKVHSVVAYYYEYYHYYYIDFERKAEGSSLDLSRRQTIYVYTGTEKDNTFTEENGAETDKFRYEQYQLAKEKGKKKVFTTEEIEKYVDTAFQNLDK